MFRRNVFYQRIYLYRTWRDRIWNYLHQRKSWRRVSAHHYLCVLTQVGNGWYIFSHVITLESKDVNLWPVSLYITNTYGTYVCFLIMGPDTKHNLLMLGRGWLVLPIYEPRSFYWNKIPLFLNSLMPESSTQCTLQKTWCLSDCPLLCMFLATTLVTFRLLSLTLHIDKCCLLVPKASPSALDRIE